MSLSSLAPVAATSAAEASPIPAAQPAFALAGNTTAARDSVDDRAELAAMRRELARADRQARQEAEARTAAEAQAAAAAAAAAEAAAAAAAEAAARAQAEAETRAAARSSRSAPRAAQAPAGGSTQTIIAFARAQIGKPYVYGAAGPNSFDCSGLTMRAYEQIGIRLGHYTGSQMGAGRRVSRGDLQPGDLVFPSSEHVGIYIGNNQIIHAPQPGDSVKISTLWSFYTAVRLV